MLCLFRETFHVVVILLRAFWENLRSKTVIKLEFLPYITQTQSHAFLCSNSFLHYFSSVPSDLAFPWNWTSGTAVVVVTLQWTFFRPKKYWSPLSPSLFVPSHFENYDNYSATSKYWNRGTNKYFFALGWKVLFPEQPSCIMRSFIPSADCPLGFVFSTASFSDKYICASCGNICHLLSELWMGRRTPCYKPRCSDIFIQISSWQFPGYFCNCLVQVSTSFNTSNEEKCFYSRVVNSGVVPVGTCSVLDPFGLLGARFVKSWDFLDGNVNLGIAGPCNDQKKLNKNAGNCI